MALEVENMNRRLRIIIGKCLYFLGKHLPMAHSYVKPIGLLSKRYRQLCGKLIMTKCGNNVNIYPHAQINHKMTLGNNSDVGYKSFFQGTCHIGENVIMGPECNVWTINHCTDRTDIAIKYQGNTEEKPVTIGDDSWIGSRVTILPGVTIGKGAVVGAGAVVSKDVPDYAVVVGNPAKVVKIRINE
jgi:Acetyltransferase (isoleucine patch superfamily)